MTTYSITLDDVDLALLPWPSYSHNNFLKKEMYEFQVMKTGSGEASPLPILYTCHLCAIEVPAAFANEHAASRKHQANVRIASVAAERMRAFISALPPPHAAETSARFCAYCSVETNEEHEKTNEHCAAVMLDNLLWDLMKAYVKDRQMSSNESNNNDKVNDKQYDVSFKDLYKNNKNSNNTPDIAIDSKQPTKLIEETVEQDEEKIKMNFETNCNLEESSNSNDNNTDDINLTSNQTENTKPILKRNNKHYGKELYKFLNDKDVFEYKEIIKISIKFNDNIINNIDSDHYHSYERDCEDGNLKCILCDCVFNDEGAEAHKYELDHMRRVANLGKDGHYIREINDFYSHCILCNLKIENINLVTHLQSATHSVKEYLYTNTRSGAHSEMEVTNVELKENNETWEPNDNLGTFIDEEELNDDLDYSGDEEIYDNLDEYSDSDEPSDILEEYDENEEFDTSIYQYSENEDRVTYLQYLEQYCKNEESVISVHDDSTDDSSEECSENQDPSYNLNEESGLGGCNSNDNLEEYSDNEGTNKGLEECCENGDSKDKQYNSRKNEETGDKLDKRIKSEEMTDNLGKYSKDDESDPDKCIIKQQDETLTEYSESGELKDNLEVCNGNEGSNMLLYGDSSHLRISINDSSEDHSDYGDPITYLQHLEQLVENEEPSMSIYDSNNFITTIDDSSELCSQNEDSNDEESGDNLVDNSGNEERHDKLKFTNKRLAECCENGDFKDKQYNCSKNGETGDKLDKCIKSEEMTDNLRKYSKDDESDPDKCIIEEPDENLTEYSESEELKDNVEACNENEGFNMSLYGECSHLRISINDSSEDHSEYGDPITYLQHLEQFVENEEHSMSIYDTNNFITIDDSSEECSQNEDFNDEESGDNLMDNTGNEERHDKLEELNEDEDLTNIITNTTPCTKKNIAKYDFENNSQKYREKLCKYIDDKDSFEFEETFITVEIKTKDKILKTYTDRFHSYNRFNDKGTIECLVCNCTFKNEDDQAHKYNLNHIRKVANLGKDGHYIREIDETYSHCILCNLKIENIHVAAHEDLYSHKFGKRLFTRSAAKKNNEDVTYAREDSMIQHSPQVTDLSIKDCESICDQENNDADQEIKVETSQINNTGTNYPKSNQETDKKDLNMTNDVKGENGTKSVELTSAVKKDIDESIANENNIKDYGDELRKLIDTKCDFEYSESSNVIRIKVNDNIINIYNDHFHSFDRTYYSKRLKCVVCDCILKFEDAEKHKYDLKHMKRIINLGNDQHFVRKIDESYSHCILCNMKIKNGILDTHKKILLHTIKKDLYTSNFDNIKLEVTTAESIDEIPRDQEVKTAKGDKAIHVDRVSYEKNKSNEPVATIRPIDIIVGTKTEYPYEFTANGNLRCVVCNCQVPNTVWNREEHVHGLRHRNMVWYRYA